MLLNNNFLQNEFILLVCREAFVGCEIVKDSFYNGAVCLVKGNFLANESETEVEQAITVL